MNNTSPENKGPEVSTQAHTDLARERTDLAEERNVLAFDRTYLAADRTLMAWMRTSLSLISFGFTMYKFFQYLRDSGTAGIGWRPSGPRNLGIALISLGIVLLIIAFIDNILYMEKLNKMAKRKFVWSSSLIASILLSLLGAFALVNIIFRVGPL
jgi:putative membrane protein